MENHISYDNIMCVLFFSTTIDMLLTCRTVDLIRPRRVPPFMFLVWLLGLLLRLCIILLIPNQ